MGTSVEPLIQDTLNKDTILFTSMYKDTDLVQYGACADTCLHI